MKSTALAAIVLTFFFNITFAADAPSAAEAAEAVDDEVEIAPNKEGGEVSTPTNDVSDFCFFAGTPSSDMKYTLVRKLKVGKGTYGGVKDILPKLADNARQAGADAIINYTGSQRFGFLPWRMVRPVVRGVAIKWSDPKNRDCSANGGTTLKAILDTDRSPSK
jgi:hypothetical protein